MPKAQDMQQLVEKIEATKELLNTMPVNNEKNKQKYMDKLEELVQEYTEYEKKLKKQLTSRYDTLVSIKENTEIKRLDECLNSTEKMLYVFNENMSSYEKMGLDKSVYIIGKFYKDNLEHINKEIKECILKFSNVGITLTVEDFTYSVFVKQYMSVFFEEMNKKELNSERLKDCFEEVYWKCPDIILHILLNIRSIYLKKEQVIDRFFEKEKQTLINKWKKEPERIFTDYLELKKKKIEKEAQDSKLLLNSFINGLNPKEYYKEKIETKINEIIEYKDEKEIKTNIFKFINSLYEYKETLNFDFVVKDIKNIYDNKGSYKKSYIETKKKIVLLEKKLNKPIIPLFKLFKKKLLQDKISKENEIILELKQLYKELDTQEFACKVEESITELSTIKDVLELASAHYTYMIDCQRKLDNLIQQDRLDETINRLNHFLLNPYHTIINNISFVQDKDISLIIKDRYILMGFKIEKKDLFIENIDSLIKELEKIERYFNLKQTKLKIEEIEEIIELRKILNK